jgi:hypothetical protein
MQTTIMLRMMPVHNKITFPMFISFLLDKQLVVSYFEVRGGWPPSPVFLTQ